MSRPEQHLTIGHRRVGQGEPCYIIAEAGVNHNGDVAAAKALADAAMAAGADAIKFQKRKLSEVYQQHILDEPRRGEQGLQYLVPLLVEFELSDDDFAELAAYCRSREIEFLCTPWDKSSVDFLERLAVPAYKIGSPDMTNFPLIEYVAKTGKPLLLSTGMSTEDEIRLTLSFIRDLGRMCGVFHCVSTYPASPDEINLQFMLRLREWCNWPVGYSGHEDGLAVSTAAVAMGATMLERHITLDRRGRGPDHAASLEPAQFKALVNNVREVESALGVPHRWISRGEVLNRRILGKSLVAAVAIPAGTELSIDLIRTKSPGLGLSPQHVNELVGRRLTRDMRMDEMFVEHDLRDAAAELMPPSIDLGIPWGVVARFLDLDSLVARFGRQGMALVELHLSDRDLDAGADACPQRTYQLGLVVHAPEYCHDTLIDLCAASEAQRQLSVSRIQKTIDLARALVPRFAQVETRGPRIVVHVGGMSRQGDPYDRVASAGRLIDSIARLDTTGVELLLENLPPCPWYFGGRWSGHILVDAAATKHLCEATGLGLCLDTSHAALACHHSGESLRAFVETVAPYVRHLHLSDGAGISGEGLQVGDGQIDFAGLWPLLAQTNATCVPEVWMGHHNTGSGFQTALNRLAEIASSARALSGVQPPASRSDLIKMVVPIDATLAAALRSIESNTKGAVFVVDAKNVVVGVVTDGDIRRGLLTGHQLSTAIGEVMTEDFVFAFDDASPLEITARLSARHRIIPILDSMRRLVNVRTRN